MDTRRKNMDELREKIIIGLDLTWKKLLESKRKTNSELVFSKNGKIVKIKARDIKD
ncbi:hypothetical protein [Ferruginibacter sp.]